MSEPRNWLGAVGRAAARVGSAVADKAAETYRAVDPDVPRHLAQIPLLSYSLFVSRREDIAPGVPDGHPPMVYVHGLGGMRGNFLPLAGYLWLQGRRRGYHIHLESDQSLDDLALAMARFVRDVKKATGEREVDIVAHSLGGLVARMAIRDHRLHRSVRTLITLGTPHRGTHAARFGNTPVIRDLRPDSALMKRLNGRPWPPSVRCVTFWSDNDLLVVPGELAALEDTERVDATPFTHYSYLIDPRGFAAVAAALRGETPAAVKGS